MGRAFASHIANSGSISGVPYGTLSLPGIISTFRARGNSWALMSLSQKMTKNKIRLFGLIIYNFSPAFCVYGFISVVLGLTPNTSHIQGTRLHRDKDYWTTILTWNDEWGWFKTYHMVFRALFFALFVLGLCGAGNRIRFSLMKGKHLNPSKHHPRLYFIFKF